VNVANRQEYLKGPEGVLNHVDPEYEHVSYVTLLENGAKVFSAPCGFKLHGNDSKLGEKQNFQLRFRSDYGMSKLHCKLFDDRETEVFNSLLLKGGSEDYMYCGFRDELCTTLVDGVTNLDVLACRPVILYLNGQYHGIYFLRERYDAFRFAQELGGVSKDSVNILRTFGFIDEGSNEAYYALLSYCSSHDMTTAEALAYVSGKIDIYSLIDWCVCRSYTGDGDITNVRFYMSEEADGKWRWCYFDLDWAFWHYRTDAIDMIVDFPEPFSPTRPRISPLRRVKSTSFRAIVGPNSFRMCFASKMISFSICTLSLLFQSQNHAPCGMKRGTLVNSCKIYHTNLPENTYRIHCF
jgi:hypothetical protein